MQRQRIISVILTGLCVLVLAASSQAEHGTASLEDVILLAEGGISDETILAFLDSREIGFEPGVEELLRLREAGVSEEIIRHLPERVATGSEKVGVDTGYALATPAATAAVTLEAATPVGMEAAMVGTTE